MFNSEFSIKAQNIGSRRFFASTLRAWKDIREALLFQLPSTEAQFLRNPLFTDSSSCVLGIRPHLSWGKMDSGPTTSVADWERFQYLLNEDKKKFSSSLRGGCLMSVHIQRDHQNGQRQVNLHNNYTWYGLISPLGFLIGAKAYTNEGRIRFYEVRDAHFLYLVEEQAEVMQLASQKPDKDKLVVSQYNNFFLTPNKRGVTISSALWTILTPLDNPNTLLLYLNVPK